MMVSVEILPFIIVAVFSGFAVLSHCFHDNLMQRIGLSGVCAGSVLTVFVMLQGHPETVGTYILLGYGLAFYSIGTALKFHKFHCEAKRHDEITGRVGKHPL